MSAAAAILSIVLAAVVFWAAIKLEIWLSPAERCFRDAYNSRRPMSDAEMIEQFYRDSSIDPAIPIRVRRIFGHQLQYDYEHLWPDDDFMFLFEELDAIELIMELEEACGVSIPDDDSAKLRPTIRNVAELIHCKLDGRTLPPWPKQALMDFRAATRPYNDGD